VGATDRDDDKTSMRGRRAPVMSDVGRLAGVSHQTVSRVINGSLHVRPETRDRVLWAMRELNYRPNSVARALVTGRSKTLGVVTFDTTLYGPATTLYGVERAAHEAGYFIIATSLKAMDRSSVPEAIERLRRHGVDGILVITPQEQSAEALLHAPAGDTPLVAVEAGPTQAVPVVAIDQLAGAAMATQHLLDLGHKTVWHITGPSDFLESQLRTHGWRTTLQAAGADAPEPLFVANDQMALGVLRAMHEAGRKVPEELSIVGFDDIPEAAYFAPPLTTVRQDFDEMGSRSVRLLLQMLETGQAPPAPAAVQPQLILRESTDVPPGRGK
jgi:DNA-binding LacI/PurR family transcriptional regulator